MTAAAKTRLLIVEDHPLVAQGLRALLSANYDVAGIVQDGRHVEQQIARTNPDVLLLDLSMPRRNGLELLPAVRKAFPDVKILVVTMHLDRGLAELAFKAGAHGFVPKESTAGELHGAIEAVLSGERYLSSRVPKKPYRATDALANPSLDRLTPRQLQILRLVGEGKNGNEIAEELSLSPRTIEFHRASIRKVLGITSEWGLVRYAIMAGLASRDSSLPRAARATKAEE